MDLWTKSKRSEVMLKIRSQNTKPEMMLRSCLHKKGYRFRIHKKGLPGKPDLLLPKYKLVIFVNGCFWHYHQNCPEGRVPKTNTEYWRSRLERTVQRDKANNKALEKLGWRVIVI